MPAFELFSGLFSSNAGRESGEIQEGFNLKAIEEIRKELGLAEGRVSPFIDAGTGALPQVIEGTTAGGLDARLGRIFDTDIFGKLVDERQRAVQGQLSAGGLTRSGAGLKAAAQVPTDIGLSIENLLSGRASNLANLGQRSAFGLNQLGSQASGRIADLLNTTGVARGEGLITDEQAEAKGIQSLISAVATAAALFSDQKLKENIEEIGVFMIKDPTHLSEKIKISLVQWDWIEEAKDTFIAACPTIGFMADRIKEVFPDIVYEYCGFDVINYPILLDRLEELT